MTETSTAAAGVGERKVDAQAQAIGELYRDHSAAALRVAYLLVGDRSRAEDLVHEAFVRLLGRIRSIRDPMALRAYLNHTVVNLSKNHFRREGIRRRFLESQANHATPIISIPDLAQRDELHRELLELPYRQRAALVLRYCEDMSEAQVAEVLGVSPKAVRSLVGRGLAALRSGRTHDG